jgi:hypothetical protein
MTYRPPLLKRWRDPFLLCLAAAGVWLGVVSMMFSSSRKADLELWLILISGAGFVSFARRSWLVWTTRVTVDDAGVRWSRGSASGALRWNEIVELGFSYTEGRRRLQIGPVRTLSKMLHPLPMMPRALYEQLKSRLGGLPPEVERDYYSRTRA